MSGVKRYEIEPGLYVVDSSGSGSDSDSLSRMADKISQEVEDEFDPSKIESCDEGYYIFVKDESRHWYMIPEEDEDEFRDYVKKLRKLDEKLLSTNYDEEIKETYQDTLNQFNEKFEKYRGKNPSRFKFKCPKEVGLE